MNAAGVVFAFVFYAAAIVCIAGLAWRIADYARTPAPLKIPTTPAPVTRGGVALRMLREVALFESLFRSNLWIWAFGWAFHAALALVLVRHLRYFIEPVWAPVVWLQPFGIYGGIVMALALAALWARRFLVDRVRYISTVSDHLMLALFAGIAGSGLAMKFASHTDIVGVKAFFLGLLRADWQPLPSHPGLYLHLTLVALLIALFPFSKLLHAPGVFFSPSRNQADTPREQRHVAAWAEAMERSKA